MSATVRIPTILRTYTAGAGEVSADGGTLASSSTPSRATTGASGPGSSTTPASCGASSTSTSATRTSGSPAGWRLPVPEGAKVSIIPAVAGG